jgi:hypothetical protein
MVTAANAADRLTTRRFDAAGVDFAVDRLIDPENRLVVQTLSAQPP